jgi:hypothetical protein
VSAVYVATACGCIPHLLHACKDARAIRLLPAPLLAFTPPLAWVHAAIADDPPLSICPLLCSTIDMELTLNLDPAAMTASDIANNRLVDTSGKNNHVILTGVGHSTDFGGIIIFGGNASSYGRRATLADGTVGTTWTGEQQQPHPTPLESPALAAFYTCWPPTPTTAMHSVCVALQCVHRVGAAPEPYGAGVVWVRRETTTTPQRMVQLNRSPSNYENQMM